MCHCAYGLGVEPRTVKNLSLAVLKTIARLILKLLPMKHGRERDKLKSKELAMVLYMLIVHGTGTNVVLAIVDE